MDKQQLQNRYNLLPNGKCPSCKGQIRDKGFEGTIYRNKLLIVEDRTNRQILKCKCGKEIYIS